jgi:hypothetical protein
MSHTLYTEECESHSLLCVCGFILNSIEYFYRFVENRCIFQSCGDVKMSRLKGGMDRCQR